MQAWFVFSRITMSADRCSSQSNAISPLCAVNVSNHDGTSPSADVGAPRVLGFDADISGYREFWGRVCIVALLTSAAELDLELLQTHTKCVQPLTFTISIAFIAVVSLHYSSIRQDRQQREYGELHRK